MYHFVKKCVSQTAKPTTSLYNVLLVTGTSYYSETNSKIIQQITLYSFVLMEICHIVVSHTLTDYTMQYVVVGGHAPADIVSWHIIPHWPWVIKVGDGVNHREDG